MNLRYANSFGNITKCVPAIAFKYFPVFETFAFPVTCTGRQYFFGLLQTEISFSLYEDTLLEPWISQFSKKVFFWMVEFCAKLKNPISLIFLTRFTTNSGQRLAILTSLVFVIHLRSAVAFSTSNTQLLYVCFKLWYFRCVSVKSIASLFYSRDFLR